MANNTPSYGAACTEYSSALSGPRVFAFGECIRLLEVAEITVRTATDLVGTLVRFISALKRDEAKTLCDFFVENVR